MGSAAKAKGTNGKSSKAKGNSTSHDFEGTMKYLKKFWTSISDEQQFSLLRLSLDDIGARARFIDAQSPDAGTSMQDRVDQLAKHGTWKSWCWGPAQKVFFTQQSFRQHIREQHVEKELVSLLPAIGSDPTASKAGQALSKRMAELVASTRERSAAQDCTQIGTITHILKTLEEREHEYLTGAYLFPVCSTVCELLPKSRRSTTWNVLSMADMAKLPASKLSQIHDWLVGHIEMPDGDDSVLSQDCKHLLIHPLFKDATVLERLYGQGSGMPGLHVKGRHPQGAPVGDAHKQLVTALTDLKSWTDRHKLTKEVLYDMLKARSNMQELAAKHNLQLGPCSQAVMERLASSKTADLDRSLTWPDSLIVAVLQREHMLAKAKLHELSFERVTKEIHVYHLRRLIRLNEPEFRQMERLLDTKGRRCWERSGADRLGKQGLEEFAALQADSEDCELAIRFEKHGFKMEEMSKEDQQAQNQLVHLDTEIKLLGLWLDSIAKMAGIFAAAGKAFGPLMPPAKTETAALEVHSRAAASGKASLKEPRSRMQALMSSVEQAQTMAFEAIDKPEGGRHMGGSTLLSARLLMWTSFQKNVWPWLYSDVEDRRLFTALQSQLRFITKFIDNGSAAMYRLESELLAAACTDPSSHMENQLVLPLLRDRINAAADDLSKAQAENQDANRGALDSKASTVSQQLLEEEDQAAARAAARRAKKQKQKAKRQESKAQQAPQQQQPPEEQQQEDQPAGGTHEVTALSTPPAANHGALTTSAVNTGMPAAAEAAAATLAALVGGQAAAEGAQPSDSKATRRSAGDPSQGSGSLHEEQKQHDSLRPPSLPQPAAAPSGMESEVEAVERLLQCPLSKEMMSEPVIAADGHTYEKTALQKWLQQHNTSPVTGVTLAHTRLVPNVLIRSILARHQQQL